MKAGQTQSEVLKIHAETPLLMDYGCYLFSTGYIRRWLISLFCPFIILVYLFYSDPPNQPLPSLPSLFVSVYFYHLILFLVSSESGSVTLFMAIRRGHVRYLKVSRICVHQGLNVDFKPFIYRYTESVKLELAVFRACRLFSFM